MSHEATNWAFMQRSLSAGQFRVLMRLCDRHNPDFGCFPSQDRLADDCEMSRSSLNNQLNALEEAGLIRREQRKGNGKRQQSTRYFFAFEEPNAAEKPCPNIGHGETDTVSKNEAEPCPKNSESRVQYLDSNPVREPVSESVTLSGEASEEAPCGAERENRKEVEREFDLAWHEYDNKLKSSRSKSLEEWLKLDPNGRSAARTRIPVFKAEWAKGGGTPSMIPAFSTYLGDKRFEQVGDPDAVVEKVEDGQRLTKFGKAWGVARLGTLRLARIVADGEGLAEPKRSHVRQPYLGNLDGSVLQVLPPERAIRQETLDGCKQVRVGSAEWLSWADYHTAKGWLFITVPDGVEWVWFPARVPEEWKQYEPIEPAGMEAG